MRWFFFGSLLDSDILTTVVGRDLPARHRRPATLPGYQRFTVVNESYPALHPEPASAVDGLVVDGLSEHEQRRVCFFEGDEFELQPRTVIVNSDRSQIEALVFIATARIGLSETVWDLASWQRQHKSDFLPMARDWMAGYGTTDPETLERQWQAALKNLK